MPKIQHVENFTPVRDSEKTKQFFYFCFTILFIILLPILLLY